MSERDGLPAAPSSAGARSADFAMLALVGALTALTAVIVSVPAVSPAILSDRLDVAIGMAAMLVSGSVAALEWARGRVAGDGAALLRASAFGVLTVLNGLTVGVLLAGAEAAVGGSLDDPGQLPLLAGIVARGVAAGLIVAAGLGAARRAAARAASVSLLVAPGLAVGAVLIFLALGPGALPILIPPDVLRRVALDPGETLAIGEALSFVVTQVVIGIGYVVGAILLYRSYRASWRRSEAIMAGGLVIAGFSQVHVAIHPGAYEGVTTTGDLLRLFFYAVLLTGVVVDRRDDLAALRRASAEIRRLSDAEVAAAGMEERARLAREIHDGLAQDLWYAKLKHSRLAQLGSSGPEAVELLGEIETAIDAALAEARHAVAAMRPDAGEGNLLEILARLVDDFNDRFAIRATLEHDGAAPELAPRSLAEALRIVQEALTNARRHADATVVRVAVHADGDVRISVSDNGRGFRPGAGTPGFGLESMRQRAELIGARLEVASAPHNGTRVELTIPRRPAEEG